MRYFKGKQFKKDIILVAVGYYCRFSLGYRDVSEILKERGISVHPTTIMRWIHEYGNPIYQIWKVKNKSARLWNHSCPINKGEVFKETPPFQRTMNFNNY